MSDCKVLMPYNFTIADEKSLNFVINTFSCQQNVHITLFNAYTPLPEIDFKASPGLTKMDRGMAHLANEIKEKERGLIDAKAFLVRHGFNADQVDYLLKKRTKSIPREIMDLVIQGNYQVVVLSRQPGKVTRFYARGLHTNLIDALKDVTVCISL